MFTMTIRCRCLPAVCLVALCVAGSLRAEITVNDLKDLKAKYDRETIDLVEKQLSFGKIAVLPEHEAKIQLAANYYTAQIKFFTPDKGKEIQDWFVKMEKLIDQGKGGDYHQAFLKVFAAESAKWALDIIDGQQTNTQLQTQINVTRYLAILASYGQEAVVPVLYKALALKNEGARYYAAKGLQGFFAQVHSAVKPMAVQDKKLESQVIVRLVELINNPEHVSDDAPEDRLEGFRTLRRELIAALAQTRIPVVKGENGNVRVAFELGRIVYGAGVVPAPRLDERVDAAIGLALLDPAAAPEYEGDCAALCIGTFVNEYALRYRINKPPKLLADTMEVLAVKFAEALVKLKDSKQASEYQKKVASMCAEVLANLDGARSNPAALKTYLDESPKVTVFFKDVKGSALPDLVAPIKFPGEK